MKTFRSLNEVEEFYFPESTKKRKEQEFFDTATPKEIGEYLAKQTMEKLRIRC